MRISGIDTGKVGLGTAQFAFREDLGLEQSIATVLAALEQGARLLDSALAYSRRDRPSYAEAVIRQALARSDAADDVLVATKGGHYRNGDSFPIDGRPETLRAHCELSLAALGVERIGLYQLHWADPSVPLSESVGALADLRREGKIGSVGLSNVNESQLQEARAIAPIAAVQNRLSVDHPGDLPFAKLCASLDIAYLAYMPLGGAGKASSGPGSGCASVGRSHGVSWQQVALAWLLLQPNVIPLVGSSRPESITDSLKAPALRLHPKDIALLPPH